MSADVSVSACYSIVRAFRNEFYFPFDRDTSRISRAVREKMPKERKQPGLPRPAYGRFFEPSRARPARRASRRARRLFGGSEPRGAAADRRSGGGREPSLSLRPSLSRRQGARASAAGRRAPKSASADFIHHQITQNHQNFNFRQLVLGCIETISTNSKLILQHS